MKEATIDRRARTLAKTLGLLYIKLYPFSQVGIPDRLVLGPEAGVLFLELKKEDEKMKKRQEIWQGRLRRLGFTCLCTTGLEETLSAIKAFARREL